MNNQTYNLHVVRNASDLPTLIAQLGANSAHSPFQSSCWLTHVYESFSGPSATPVLMVVEDQQGPLLLLPLCIRQRFGLKVLEFADYGVCDYNGPIVNLDRSIDPERLADSLTGMARLLPEVDLVRWSKMPRMIGGLANPLAALPRVKQMQVGAWAVGLPSTMADYETTCLSKSFRKELHKKIRRTQGRGRLEHRYATTLQERSELFELLFLQRQARCDEMGRYHQMSHPPVKNFYKGLLADPSCQPMAEISALFMDNQPVATLFTLHQHTTSFVLMTTFENQEWKSCSLGNLMMYSGITQCINRGDTTFDLTLGDESYKRDFGATRNQLMSYQVALSAKGHLAGLAGAVVERCRPPEDSPLGRLLHARLARAFRAAEDPR